MNAFSSGFSFPGKKSYERYFAVKYPSFDKVFKRPLGFEHLQQEFGSGIMKSRRKESQVRTPDCWKITSEVKI